jgi:SOCE-associated regulatory factor of calcium homoeostasis
MALTLIQYIFKQQNKYLSGLNKFFPVFKVVQCYNRGWDGLDVNWECKTDLDQVRYLINLTVCYVPVPVRN